jgi:hypothetical protein
MSQIAAIGLRAKTARAITVVLTGPSDAPQILRRTELALTSPSKPATAQPYHEVMALPWAEAVIAVRPIVALIEDAATAALLALLRELRSAGLDICGVGVVGAPDRKLERIGNPHIRAHAAEGVAYRSVLEVAAERNGLQKFSFPERSLENEAIAGLECTESEIQTRLSALGRAIGPPWRADERAAALAAWLALRAFPAP